MRNTFQKLASRSPLWLRFSKYLCGIYYILIGNRVKRVLVCKSANVFVKKNLNSKIQNFQSQIKKERKKNTKLSLMLYLKFNDLSNFENIKLYIFIYFWWNVTQFMYRVETLSILNFITFYSMLSNFF